MNPTPAEYTFCDMPAIPLSLPVLSGLAIVLGPVAFVDEDDGDEAGQLQFSRSAGAAPTGGEDRPAACAPATAVLYAAPEPAYATSGEFDLEFCGRE